MERKTQNKENEMLKTMAYCAIRKSGDEPGDGDGYWIDTGTLSLTIEEARQKAEEINKIISNYEATCPISSIAKVIIIEAIQ